MADEETMNPETPREANPNEDEFLDERPIEVTPEEEAPAAEPEVVEEAPVEERAPEEPAEEEQGSDPSEHFVFDDPRLEAIEEARKKWNKGYRRTSLIKTFVAIGVLLLIVVGWVVPTMAIRDAGALPLYIALGIAAVGIIGLLIFNLLQKKFDQAGIHAYFEAYYRNLQNYTFDGVIEGEVDVNPESKVSNEEVEASGLYPGATNIGSRNNVTFTYKNMDCALADMAVQKNVSRGLQTVFVGKYLRTHNTFKPDCQGHLIIYFKGNDRAIPPLAIAEMTPLEDNAKFAIYGPAPMKKLLTHKIKTALRQIRTDKLLVDVAISIEEGRTYWALGYEDDLMVLPNKDPFDPYYVQQYKKQFLEILEIALLMNEGAEA